MPDVVGFIGLGRMGSNMARNVAARGHELVVFNRTTTVSEGFAEETGCRAAASARELAERCDIVITMLADGAALLETYRGDAGVAAGLKAGALAVDMGTSGPAAVEELRPLVEASGSRLVDAPVSGSTPAAKDGTLLVMVGASDQDFTRVEPVLSAIGNPELVGPPGSAATLKLAVNSILYGINQALAEAVILAERAGVDPAKVLDVVGRSAAGAPMVRYRVPQYLDPDNTPITFTLDLAAKDMDLALEKAAEQGGSMPQGVRTRQLLGVMIERGWGGKDLGYAIEANRQMGPGE